MDIKIEEKDNLYTVQVEVPSYNTKIKRKTIVHTSEVRREVQKKGYEIGKTIEAAYIHNINGVTKGTWVFEKKNLDKPVKDAILEESKTVSKAPTPKAPPKRKRRTSTKKKTVEE
mgnify:CR=1 FL=1